MLEGEVRREKIMHLLAGRELPLKGSELAGLLEVSRQVIVQDVAILRAGGQKILATPQGYLLAEKMFTNPLTRIIACCHGLDKLQEELFIIVDCGAHVLDVLVEHPLYGELKGLLMLSSRREAEDFRVRLVNSGAQPLSALTKGVHLHTLVAEREEIFSLVEEELASAGILLTL